MALRIRFQYPTGNHLGYSIERLADGLPFDFADSTFKAAPGQRIADLPEDKPPFAGRYRVTLDPTPAAQFHDGDYCVTVHHTAEGNVVVAELGATMHGGDDATVFPFPFAWDGTIRMSPTSWTTNTGVTTSEPPQGP